jgi:hypothetical protein
LAADPKSLIDEANDNLDPFAVWKTFMADEKPGGRAVAKIARLPLWQLLSERYNAGRHDQRVLVYPGGGYYCPGKELEGLRAEMRGYQEQGYKMVKMKIGGADLAEAVVAVAGGGRMLPSTPMGASIWRQR